LDDHEQNRCEGRHCPLERNSPIAFFHDTCMHEVSGALMCHCCYESGNIIDYDSEVDSEDESSVDGG
jgi:hypothetical protein